MKTITGPLVLDGNGVQIPPTVFLNAFKPKVAVYSHFGERTIENTLGMTASLDIDHIDGVKLAVEVPDAVDTGYLQSLLDSGQFAFASGFILIDPPHKTDGLTIMKEIELSHVALVPKPVADCPACKKGELQGADRASAALICDHCGHIEEPR